MEKQICTSCKMPKAVFACGKCEKALCKKCVQILEKNSFPFLDPVPPDLSHKNYCINCYNETIGPTLESYEKTMSRAKAVFVFHIGLSEETRKMSRSEKPLKIVGCADKAEATLRLAFSAAKAGFNALIDVDVFPVKVRNEGFQTTEWKASGVPLTLDPKLLPENKK